ncbi:flagellar basal-body rod protein FlgF [Neokomagataea tanensis]|uniref:Flagellar basal-body rod protein FlgF n=1 Tax=Neokomagataea tanensis TaxID=661191 RepID=A0A4Y6VBH9_9PROT|nr:MULTISPECIES: flagellar basal-body rod protein FlgF [Neokomagataea]QDH25866.1 flagellar basal-body rod protein FlgF [Neokomagataea tanensis]
MENTTYIALSKMDAQQRAMSVIATNMANASTVGFKREDVLFSDYLSQQRATHQPAGAESEAYTQDRATYRDVQQGDLQQTGNALDLALGGQGYFQVQTANGVRLTRAGKFEQQADGSIVDESGNALLDRAGRAIKIPAGDQNISISSDGVLSTESGDQAQIAVVSVADENALKAEGGHLFATSQPTQPVAQPHMAQGMLEGSNVQMMSEVTKMLDIQRNFQFMAQFINAEATRQQNAIDKIVQVSA